MHADTCGARIERWQMKIIFSCGKDRILLDITVRGELKENVNTHPECRKHKWRKELQDSITQLRRFAANCPWSKYEGLQQVDTW